MHLQACAKGGVHTQPLVWAPLESLESSFCDQLHSCEMLCES